MVSGAHVFGNGTGIVVGNGSVLSGSFDAVQNVVVLAGGKLDPTTYNWNTQLPYYYQSAGNSGGSAILPPPKAATQTTGGLTLSSSSTFSPRLTGDTGAATLFNFNNAVVYPFAVPPDSPVNGVVPSPYGALLNWFAGAVQDGSGQLVIGPPATNGYGLDFLFGLNNRPTDTNLGEPPDQFVLLPTDVSEYSNVTVKLKLLPSNQAHTLWFGLVDDRGNANQYTIDLSTLNTATYSTVTIPLLTPSIDLIGPDGHMDLTKICGYVFGSDEGTGSTGGVQNTPLGIVVDEVGLTSTPNSVLNVTGTVNLGGATLDGSVAGTALTWGQQYTIIDNDGVDAVVGTFAGVPEGSFVNLSGRSYLISYVGGDGNDVVLTIFEPPPPPPKAYIFYNQSAFDAKQWRGHGPRRQRHCHRQESRTSPAAELRRPVASPATRRGSTASWSTSAGTHGTITASDFIFKVGANNTPSSWALAPAPTTVSVRPGAGDGGSDRVEIDLGQQRHSKSNGSR